MRDEARPTVPLSGKAVADAEGERSAGSRKATVRLDGVLAETPELVSLPHLRNVQTTAQVEAGHYVFSVLALGDVAKALNAIGRRGAVVIEGYLVRHEWTTEDGTKRSKLEIRADKVERG